MKLWHYQGSAILKNGSVRSFAGSKTFSDNYDYFDVSDEVRDELLQKGLDGGFWKVDRVIIDRLYEVVE